MSPMAQLYLRNAKKLNAPSSFPPTDTLRDGKAPRCCKRFRESYLYAPTCRIDLFDSTDPKRWRMFLLLGMKCIRKMSRLP